jgi:hypothetical protein
MEGIETSNAMLFSTQVVLQGLVFAKRTRASAAQFVFVPFVALRLFRSDCGSLFVESILYRQANTDQTSHLLSPACLTYIACSISDDSVPPWLPTWAASGEFWRRKAGDISSSQSAILPHNLSSSSFQLDQGGVTIGNLDLSLESFSSLRSEMIALHFIFV